jgi:hypothetical protein
MSRLALALILLALGGCTTLSTTWSRATAAREFQPSWDCGEPAADAASDPHHGEGTGGEGSQP